MAGEVRRLTDSPDPLLRLVILVAVMLAVTIGWLWLAFRAPRAARG